MKILLKSVFSCLLEETEVKYEEASKRFISILAGKDDSIKKLENQIGKLEVHNELLQIFLMTAT